MWRVLFPETCWIITYESLSLGHLWQNYPDFKNAITLSILTNLDHTDTVRRRSDVTVMLESPVVKLVGPPDLSVCILFFLCFLILFLWPHTFIFFLLSLVFLFPKPTHFQRQYSFAEANHGWSYKFSLFHEKRMEKAKDNWEVWQQEQLGDHSARNNWVASLQKVQSTAETCQYYHNVNMTLLILILTMMKYQVYFSVLFFPLIFFLF